MAANYECHRNRIGVEFTTSTRPAPKHDHHIINFNFRFMTVYVNWLQNPNPTSHPIYDGEATSAITTASTTVLVLGATPDQEIREAIKKDLQDHLTVDADRQRVIDIAMKAAWDEVARNKDKGAVYIDFIFQVMQKHNHIYYDDEGDHHHHHHRMIPAADSSFELLKEYEVGGDVITTEGCCCVCLEELEEGELLFSMPCHHVFHEHCIKKWLKTSHYCPLCRFEMPISN